MKEQIHPITNTRKALGLSQQQLADKSGISRAFISYMENGYVPRRARARQAVAEALGVPSISLFKTKESGPHD